MDARLSADRRGVKIMCISSCCSIQDFVRILAERHESVASTSMLQTCGAKLRNLLEAAASSLKARPAEQAFNLNADHSRDQCTVPLVCGT